MMRKAAALVVALMAALGPAPAAATEDAAFPVEIARFLHPEAFEDGGT